MGLFDKLKRAFAVSDPEESEEKRTEQEQEKKEESHAQESQTAKQVQEAPEDEAPVSQSGAETKEEQSDSEVTEDDEHGLEEQDLEVSEKEEQEVTDEQRYDQGLKKSRQGFGAKINALLANFRHVDEDFFDDLEETLIEADVGFDVAVKISDELRDEVKLRNAKAKKEVSDAIVEKLVDIYEEEGHEEDNSLHFATAGQPTVFLFVGVNGVGKTTTIGKLAHKYQQEGKKVLLAACDTFRAGAIEQLNEWAKSVNVDIVKKPAQSDPAAVVFDAVKKAKTENYDILLVDTAGRLQNKVNLMNELAKIKRVIQRELPESPQEVLLALDATTGQNALTQAKQFKDVTEVSGIVLTKLDGTARGGIVLAIRNELHLPVKLVGLGEQMDDLRTFDAEKFVYGLFKDLIAQPAK
ncbi:cell division protein FtsY [Ligilactobacillus salitolerans]|uniref:Signal recognition particle receptor FtsY n=1 Tax=Ligilactobacillus salitolerans TaxID=1808352 RepID=A0A401IRI2_9LACO|nr:signal recognition particle-docking protein FtsY [Ligilactobacillus salitolerans]GBG94136.1 cell division protein FtsY [Ligilactobacillus salitolerans]